jgi:hypothetical protein
MSGRVCAACATGAACIASLALTPSPSGAPPSVEIAVELVRAKKHVTHVRGLETFGVGESLCCVLYDLLLLLLLLWLLCVWGGASDVSNPTTPQPQTLRRWPADCRRSWPPLPPWGPAATTPPSRR